MSVWEPKTSCISCAPCGPVSFRCFLACQMASHIPWWIFILLSLPSVLRRALSGRGREGYGPSPCWCITTCAGNTDSESHPIPTFFPPIIITVLPVGNAPCPSPPGQQASAGSDLCSTRSALLALSRTIQCERVYRSQQVRHLSWRRAYILGSSNLRDFTLTQVGSARYVATSGFP